MNENIKNLINYIEDNPDLPVVAMVDSDIVADDGFSRWLGGIGKSYVGEYACYGDRFFDDRDEFKEHYYDWHDEELCDRFNYNPRITQFAVDLGEYPEEILTINKGNETRLDAYLDEIADKYFIKAIIVDVDLV